MAKATTERETFVMHPRLLWDIITKQAGTLAKAILEGAMNSIDAGATRCDIEISRTSFSIKDDGKGFADEAEIKKFFKTFGYPHDKGDATYGRFRMGRGQMFSFGVNKWLSNEFQMDVDLKPQEDSVNEGGLGFDFSRGHKPVKGCHIMVDLYDKLIPSELDATIREISDFVKWAQIPVTINGKQVSKRPSDEKWDIETDDAYISLKDRGSLDVYNLGVLVCRTPSYNYGTGGTVVSKKQLDVNFARNDVQSSCPVWKRVSKHLRKTVTEENVRKPKLNDSERGNLCTQLRTGELSIEDALKLKLITDATGTHQNLSVLEKIGWRYGGKITVAPIGDRVAETIHTRRLAFVISQDTLDRFNVESADALVKLLKERAQEEFGDGHYGHARAFYFALDRVQAVPRAEFDKVISSDHIPLGDQELSPAERFALKVARAAAWPMARAINQTAAGDLIAPGGLRARAINAGVSDTADAWTDGTQHIWINRSKLRLVKDGYPGMVQLAALLLHEYEHGAPDTATHLHDAEFYKRHHDLAIDTKVLGAAADAMLTEALSLIRKEDKNPTGALRKAEDSAALFSDKALDLPQSESQQTAEPEASAEDLPAPRVAARETPKRKPSKAAKKDESAEAVDVHPTLPGLGLSVI